MNIKELFDQKLLRKIPKDLDKVNKSINISEDKLIRAKELIDSEFFEEALVSAYMSMFHAARAILYNDGIQEKSHFAIYIYLGFRNYQLERHEINYGFDIKVSQDNAEEIISDAEKFLEAARRVLSNGKI